MIYVARYLLIVLYTIVWGIPACLVPLVDRSGEAVIWIGRQWIRWIFWSCGIRVEAAGLENVDPRHAYVFMSNHQSVTDVGALVLTLPVSWRFVVASLRRAAQRIRSGVNMIIFPEGTRSETGEMRPFKSGGFHLALEAQVPIVPVSISGSKRLTVRDAIEAGFDPSAPACGLTPRFRHGYARPVSRPRG